MIEILILGALGIVALNYKSEIVEKVEENLDSWTQYDHSFQVFGAVYGVEWTWLKAIALNESDLGKAKSVARGLEFPKDIEGSKSSDGKSWGLMQVTLRTARGLDPEATEEKLNDPEYSIELASKYISQLQKMFNPLSERYVEAVIKSYNQGPGNTKKELDGETSGYAKIYWERFQRNLNRVKGSL